jgi:hypothetical protein
MSAISEGTRGVAVNNDSKEPFAWALSQDNKTIVGADTDRYYWTTVLSADQIEKCYAQDLGCPARDRRHLLRHEPR